MFIEPCSTIVRAPLGAKSAVVISTPKRARNFLFTVASINISSLRDDGNSECASCFQR